MELQRGFGGCCWCVVCDVVGDGCVSGRGGRKFGAFMLALMAFERSMPKLTLVWEMGAWKVTFFCWAMRHHWVASFSNVEDVNGKHSLK